MAYFRERNKIKTEFSGYEDVSRGLRERIHAIITQRVITHVNDMTVHRYVASGALNHQIKLRLNKTWGEAILTGSYDETFETLEIFLELASGLYSIAEIVREILLAFDVAGSVYTLNAQHQVVLRVSDEVARDIKSAETELEDVSSDSLEYFHRAVRGLITRERTANDVVKDLAITAEHYLEDITGKTNLSDALKSLQEQGVLAAGQRGVIDKLYAYRGDAEGVAHSGNTQTPGEADALWFLETLLAQIKLIRAKMPKSA